MKILKITKECAAVFVIGGVIYSLMEIMWRGRTHWTMSLTGGGSFLYLYMLHTRDTAEHIIHRALMGAAAITSLELSVGCIVNRALGWGVWDYSGMKYNILGQICLIYSLLWFLLSLAACPVAHGIRRIVGK